MKINLNLYLHHNYLTNKNKFKMETLNETKKETLTINNPLEGKLLIAEALKYIKENITNFDDLKKLRKELSETVIQKHDEYEAPKPRASHLVAKDEAIEKILNEVMGFNAALRVAKKYINDGTISIAAMSAKGVTDSQVTWTMKEIKRVKLFMLKEEQNLQAFTPKIIINALIRAGELKPSEYSKRVLTLS